MGYYAYLKVRVINFQVLLKGGDFPGIDSLHRHAVNLAIYKKWFRKFIDIKGEV